MKNKIQTVSIIGLMVVAPLASSDTITDSYSTGDTLTAATLDGIKSAVNDNDLRITAIEGGATGVEIPVDCNADSSALINTSLKPGFTYVLTGMCDGPIYLEEPAGKYSFRGDASGVKDDGITSPPGQTQYYVVGMYGPISARFENLTISGENYTSQSDGVYTASFYIEGNASVSLYDLDIVGGDAGIFSDNAYVYIGQGVNVSGFGQSGILAGRGGSVLVGEELTVAGATGLPGSYSEALASFRNGVIQINNGGTFTAGTDDGSNPDYEGNSIGAYDNGTVRIQNSGTVTLSGTISAFSSSVIRIRTGTTNGIVWSGDQSYVKFENMTHSGGDIEIFRGSGFQADNSTISSGSSNIISVGQMSNIRLNASTVGNASGVASIELYGYGYLSLRNGTNLSGRNIDCIDAQSFSPSDAVNIGTVSC